MRYGSWVLSPLAVLLYWGLPPVLVAAVAVEVWRSVRHRDRLRAERSTWRDRRALLLGACVGAALAYAPVIVWLEGRLGMLLVLPTLGASVGLILSGLAPSGDGSPQRVADLQPRRLWSYVSIGKRRLLVGACCTTLMIAVVRLVLPPERPAPELLVELLGREPALAPTRALYVVAAMTAIGIAAASLLAARGIVTRSRPAADDEALALRERDRQLAANRVVSWTTALLLLLNATLLTPFPRKMGGVVFGDVQFIQRAADLLIVACVGAAAATMVLAHRRPRPLAIP